MDKFVLDIDLRSRLNGLHNHLEICDQEGNTLGHYLPVDQFNRLLYSLAEAQRPQLSPEEIDRRRQETGRSLKEIWKSLGIS